MTEPIRESLRRWRVVASACLVAVGTIAVLAQSPGPQPLPLPAPLPAPRDTPYPGTIRLDVDATDLDHHLFKVHETVPVRGGETVLLYPQWLPGNHSPTGRVDKLGGLIIRANGKRVEWVRDTVNVFAFHVPVPAGATTLDADFVFESPIAADEGRVVMTPDLLNLQWTGVTLYPAGYFARQITVAPSVHLPEGWHAATALEPTSTSGGVFTYKAVTLETLIDSPMFAGRYFRQVDLDSGAAPVRLDIVADRPELLAATDPQLDAHRALARQATTLFGSHHYDHYDLMLALSDHMSGIGLEHHRSSENGTVPTYFTEWNRNADVRDLLAHEFTHSWNGKFRRPADLWTPSYEIPMRGSLLWVYEGQTQYWGFVLAARSRLLTKQQALDAIAGTAALYDHRPGREWKTLEDTTNDPVAALRRPLAWRSLQRSEDYYSEGQLVWLDVDTLIRERSGGKRSLDDFARAFFGVENGSYVPVTYTFDDLVKALNGIEPYDWSTFLHARLESHGPGAPLDGIARGGYKLVYTDAPSDYFRGAEVRRRITDLTYSVGMVVGNDGRLTDVLWDGPAFKAGLAINTQIVSVNGVSYDSERLKAAVADTARSGATLALVVRAGDRVRSVAIDYHGGLRYPHLERNASGPARLDDILSPR